jgi:pimeloyl-ACP methyl ester carboxylesterase
MTQRLAPLGVAEDAQGDIWLGTTTGLYRGRSDGATWTRYSVATGALKDDWVMALTTDPTNGAVFAAKGVNAAWKTKPTFYVVAANDRMINPDLERKFAKAMKARTITVPSSHVAMLSHPAEVAKLIVEAARSAPAR